MSKHGNRVLLGIIVGVSVTVATAITLTMGQPADITSATGYDQATTQSTDTTTYDVGTVVCQTPTEDSSLTGCDFDPAGRLRFCHHVAINCEHRFRAQRREFRA